MRISPLVASAFDQALLSLLNLGISFAFIKFSTKADYGIYLLLMAPLYLATGIQNALVLSPIATVYPSSPSDRKAVVYATAVASQVAFIAICGIISGLGLAVYWYVVHGKIAYGLIGGFAIATCGICARESVRTLFYTTGNASKALESDLVYATGLAGIFALLCYFQFLTPESALLATGVSALWPLLLTVSRLHTLTMDLGALKQFWECGKWALIGVLVSWINLNAYPLIVGVNLNAGAVAEINVARLFLMPVGLCGAAWANLYRPKISGWAAQGLEIEIRKLTLRSIAIGVSLLAAFLLILAIVFPYAEGLLGKTYQGLLPLVLLWGVFFAVSLARGMLMATLMTEPDGYRQLQSVSWVALLISTSGLWFLSPWGVGWVIGVLIAVELVQAVLIGIKARRWWRPDGSRYA